MSEGRLGVTAVFYSGVEEQSAAYLLFFFTGLCYVSLLLIDRATVPSLKNIINFSFKIYIV